MRIKLAKAELAAIAAQAAGREVITGTRRVLNRARVLSPWDTGNLRASHTMLLRRMKTRVVGRVSTRVKYALAVHEGAAPHIIRAKRGRALKFKIGGRTVFARSVRHPGNPGRPWLRQAVTEVAAGRGYTVRRPGRGGSEA